MIVSIMKLTQKEKIILKTNLDLSIPLDKDHKLELKKIGEEQIPFVQVRDNIEGFISRSILLFTNRNCTQTRKHSFRPANS